MGFEVLLTPIAAALAILATVVVLDTRTVFVKSIDVPLQLWSAGYSSQTLQEDIANSMLDVEREGRARDATRQLALDQGDDSIDDVVEYFELTPLVRAFQQSGGFVSYVVDGYVTQDGGNYVMSLDISARDGSEFNTTVSHPREDIPGFVRKGAEAIMRFVEPEPLCASFLAKALAGKESIDKADSCVRETLATAAPSNKVWLLNLAGVIQYMQGDQAAAMERFHQALKIAPTFSPALLNVGVLLAGQGKPAEAEKAYKFLFADLNDGVSDRTYAAAYVEWAKSEVALGRPDQAMATLRKAVAANPDYAESYHQLAKLLPPGAEADRLRDKGDYLARTKDQVYTENLIGPVFEAANAYIKPL
jgi:tetratricopeptide (TPR) repeat protein